MNAVRFTGLEPSSLPYHHQQHPNYSRTDSHLSEQSSSSFHIFRSTSISKQHQPSPRPKSWGFERECTSYNYYRDLSKSDEDNAPHHIDSGEPTEEQDEQERLASLEALRYALHHAPFCRNMHTLMSVPNEECFEMIGIPTKCAIRIESLSCGNMLDNINLEIPKGKIYALLGSTNNGKSLLLKCILGRERPTNSGASIVVFGQKPTSVPLSAICVGYMPQRIALHPELTIEQTILYYGHLYQLPPSMICHRLQILDAIFNGVHSNDHPSISSTTLVQELNEGNLWRLSLVIAMIHSPPLLLLDEPTDNVDPLIRSTVWSYLEKLCENEGVTIVFTTKHPEELCYAYKAGLMRDGHVYLEDRPKELLRNYHCQTYIQMYNKFCMSNIPRRLRPSIECYQNQFVANMTIPQLSFQTSTHSTCQSVAEDTTADSSTSDDQENISSRINQTSGPRNNATATSGIFPSLMCNPNLLHNNNHNSEKNNQPHNESYSIRSNYSGSSMDLQDLQRSSLPLPMAQWPIAERRRTAFISHLFNLDLKRLFSLVMKNFYVIMGNCYTVILFYFIFPSIQIILVCFIFGRPLTSIHDLPVTILTSAQNLNNPRMERLINYSIDRKVFHPQIAHDLSSEDFIRPRRSWATIVPWSIEESVNESSHADRKTETKASDYCQQWTKYWLNQYNTTMFGLRLYLDSSNFFINYLMNYTLENSMHQLLSDDNRMRELFPPDCPNLYLEMKFNHRPIIIEETLYGSPADSLRFLEFILPGILIAIIFGHSLILTSYLFIKEQIAGLQERCLTAGASGIEVLISHMISQSILFFLQELILILIMKNLFGVPSHKVPWYGPWSLITMQGFMGIITGLFVGVICPRPKTAGLFISGIFIPGFVLSGITWPVEALPEVIYYFSLTLPLTQPINSLRYIIFRGLNLHFDKIAAGYYVSSIYIVLMVSLTLTIFKIKTSS